MSGDSKTAVSFWWILVLIALFLWYRNEKYDRVLAAFIVGLALVQLIQYAIYSGADSNQSIRAIFVILWLQCIILAIGVYVFIATQQPSSSMIKTIAGWNLILFAIFFVVSLLYAIFSTSIFSSDIDSNGHISWLRDGGQLLGGFGWLYLIGIFLPLFLLFAYYDYADLPMAILILYAAITAAWVGLTYNIEEFGSIWSYFAIGFAFLAYALGIQI